MKKSKGKGRLPKLPKLPKPKRLPKYALGGTALNTDSPAEALFEMIRMSEESGFEAGNDPLVAGLKGLGGMMVNSGMSMVGGGMAKSGDLGGTGGFLQDNFGTISKVVGAGNAGMQTFKKGGNVNAPHIEVEGDEMFETPNGQVGEFDGPSHEQGGIPLKVKSQGVAKDGEVPGGTYIYPDSIKIGGKSLADRKKLREKKENKLEDLLGDSSDKILKNTLGRVQKMNQIEDMFDRTIQEHVKGQGEGEKYAEGGGIPPMVNVAPPSTRRGYGVMDMLNTFESGYEDFSGWDGTYNTGTTQEQAPGSFDMSGLPTMGDAMGIAGNLYQAYKPRSLTLKNRAGDTPNINPFDNYGTEALDTLEGNIPLLGQIKDTQMQRLESNRNASMARNNNSARGINTQRALNLATDSQMNTAEGDLMAKYAEQLLGVNNQIAATELDVSGKKAQGEQYRDVSDRQDRDQFFSNLSKDEAAVGEAWSRTGKATNQIKTRGVQSKFLNQMFDNVQGDLMNGTISQKNSAGIGRNANEVIDGFKNSEAYKKMSKEEKQQFNNMDALSILNMLGIFK